MIELGFIQWKGWLLWLVSKRCFIEKGWQGQEAGGMEGNPVTKRMFERQQKRTRDRYTVVEHPIQNVSGGGRDSSVVERAHCSFRRANLSSQHQHHF